MAVENKFNDENFLEACFNQIREIAQGANAEALVLRGKIQAHFDRFVHQKTGHDYYIASVQAVSLETIGKKNGGYTLKAKADSELPYLAPEEARKICQEYKSKFPWISEIIYSEE